MQEMYSSKKIQIMQLPNIMYSF